MTTYSNQGGSKISEDRPELGHSNTCRMRRQRKTAYTVSSGWNVASTRGCVLDCWLSTRPETERKEKSKNKALVDSKIHHLKQGGVSFIRHLINLRDCVPTYKTNLAVTASNQASSFQITAKDQLSQSTSVSVRLQNASLQVSHFCCSPGHRQP